MRRLIKLKGVAADFYLSLCPQKRIYEFSEFIIKILEKKAFEYNKVISDSEKQQIIDNDEHLFDFSKCYIVEDENGNIVGTSRIVYKDKDVILPEEIEWPGLSLVELQQRFDTDGSVYGFGRSATDTELLSEYSPDGKLSNAIFLFIAYTGIKDAWVHKPNGLWLCECEKYFGVLLRRKFPGAKVLTEIKDVLGTPTFALGGAIRDLKKVSSLHTYLGSDKTKSVTIVSQEERYSRHKFFIGDIQFGLSEKKVLVAGTGMASILAECILRDGVENITLADGKNVSPGSFVRQNFTENDIGFNKAIQLAKRLISINPLANINVIDKYLLEDDLRQYIPEHDIIVNTIDFDHPSFIVLNTVARQKGKIVLFPVNFSLFGGTVAVFKPDSETFEDIFGYCDSLKELKIKILVHWVEAFKKSGQTKIQEVLDKYMSSDLPYEPQMALGGYSVAYLITKIIIQLYQTKDVETFPKIHIDRGVY